MSSNPTFITVQPYFVHVRFLYVITRSQNVNGPRLPSYRHISSLTNQHLVSVYHHIFINYYLPNTQICFGAKTFHNQTLILHFCTKLFLQLCPLIIKIICIYLTKPFHVIDGRCTFQKTRCTEVMVEFTLKCS